MSKDPRMSAFIKFFESQGVRFVDADTRQTVTVDEDGNLIRKDEHENKRKNKDR